MKWTKSALLLVIPALALLFLGQSMRPPAAQARPSTILTINQTFCVTLTAQNIDWNGDGKVDGGDATEALFDCQNGIGPHETAPNVVPDGQDLFDNMIGALRNIPEDPPGNRIAEVLDSPPTPEDFTAPGKSPAGSQMTPMDSDAGQMHEKDGTDWIIAFVSNDDPVAFFADKGVFALGNHVIGSSIVCGPGGNPANADFQFSDPDCDENPATVGDGVVLVKLEADGADRGPATVRVRQDHLEMEDQYTIVGEPHSITLTPSKTTIQTGAAVCNLFSDTASYVAALGSAVRTPFTTVVKDSDGTAITAALVVYEIDGEDGEMVSNPNERLAQLALPIAETNLQQAVVPTLSSALGVASPNVICGDQLTGTITLKAETSKFAGPAGLDPQAPEKHAEVEMTVKGPPTNMVLSAAPPSLACDGTATSTVSAALTDAAGTPAVDGNAVDFSVRALGTIAPLQGKSAGGAATTVLTPLSDILRGVTVDATLMTPTLDEDDSDVTAGDIAQCKIQQQFFPCPKKTEVLEPSDIESALLVECSTGATQPVPLPGTGAPSPIVSPPNTGDGGYLP